VTAICNDYYDLVCASYRCRSCLDLEWWRGQRNPWGKR